MRDPDIDPDEKTLKSRGARFGRDRDDTEGQESWSANSETFLRALAATNDDPIPVPLALDIRFPACHLLSYGEDLAPAYVDALIGQFRKLSANLDSDRQLLHLAVSGQSAAAVGVEQWCLLGKELAQGFRPAADSAREFTWHASSHALDTGLLHVLKEAGINRLGLCLKIDGSASPNSWHLQIEEAVAIVEEVRRAGIGSLRLCVLGASELDVQESINKAIEILAPDVVVFEDVGNSLRRSSPFVECSGDFDILGLGYGASSRLGDTIYPGTAKLIDYLRESAAGAE